LFIEYEQSLKLRERVDLEEELGNEENVEINNVPIAIIESEKKLHVFRVNIRIDKARQIPNNPQININFSLQLPANIQPQQIPQQIQNVLNGIMNQVNQQIPQIVNQEIIRQSPVLGVNARMYGGRWYEER